jgi:hypothetical protein
MTFSQNIQVGKIPQSVEEFVALRDQIARTPQGGAATMILALLAFAEDASLGQACLAAAVAPERLVEGRAGYGGHGLGVRDLQLIQMQIGNQPHIPRSYVQGAIPENGYALPDPPYPFAFQSNPHSGDEASGEYKVFIVSSGADSARPLTLRRDEEGIWRAREWSSLLVGVRQPE